MTPAPFVGEVRIFPWGFAPKGWVPCDGKPLASATYPDLFRLIGTTYGGDATNFLVPDLRDRVPIGADGSHTIGTVLGEAAHTLTSAEMAAHTHPLPATNQNGSSAAPAGNLLAAANNAYHSNASAQPMHPQSISTVGGAPVPAPGTPTVAAPHENRQPYLALWYCISTGGIVPSPGPAPPPGPVSPGQPDAYLGEIRYWPANFAPFGWMFCGGQQLPISENEGLYQLIGVTFGGDNQSNFNLPNLENRVPVHISAGSALAATGGVESVTLTPDQIPAHSHRLLASVTPGNENNPGGNLLAETAGGLRPYVEDSPTEALAADAISAAGGGQAHSNLQPYLCVNFIIYLYGTFPSPT